MNIAIIGSRGIPNNYGGFEQFAEYLAKGLAKKGHKVTVYNSHTHPYKQSEWNGVRLVHCHDLEEKLGTAGQFVYDLNCILHARKQNYEVILQLGYTSSTVWGWLLPRKKTVTTTNMDGLEWKRTKYARPVRWFLKKAEHLAIIFSDYLISDSIGIQSYLYNKYNVFSTYIPYGANLFDCPDPSILNKYNLKPGKYNMLVARLEPENNIDIILEGASKAIVKNIFLVVGSHTTTYGEYLKEKYKKHKNICFSDGIYDIDELNNLRYYSNLYFHGHSVGGTNPSLLEAMASNALICAHKNVFNSTILKEDALYFEGSREVTNYINDIEDKYHFQSFLNKNIEKIDTVYKWESIVDQYEDHFNKITKISASEVLMN